MQNVVCIAQHLTRSVPRSAPLLLHSVRHRSSFPPQLPGRGGHLRGEHSGLSPAPVPPQPESLSKYALGLSCASTWNCLGQPRALSGLSYRAFFQGIDRTPPNRSIGTAVRMDPCEGSRIRRSGKWPNWHADHPACSLTAEPGEQAFQACAKKSKLKEFLLLEECPASKPPTAAAKPPSK